MYVFCKGLATTADNFGSLPVLMRLAFYRGVHPIFQHLKQFHVQKPVMTKALVILAEGAEEMETVITVDILRRAEVGQLSPFLLKFFCVNYPPCKTF